MKYPLATVNCLVLQDFGSDICLVYDIMCAFSTTLKQSSLGKKAVAFRPSGVVPAFHSHAHNHGCQVEWHPLYVEGVGLEDFEECECTFCHSHQLHVWHCHSTASNTLMNTSISMTLTSTLLLVSYFHSALSLVTK